jgi:dihydroorotase
MMVPGRRWKGAFSSLLFSTSLLSAQTYDLLIKGGHVIDPANRIDGIMDVAISGNRIARVSAEIPTSQARKVIDAAGLYVTPGLVDLHAHVYGYEGSLLPDDTALIAGTTTVVDAGGSGWRTFDDFRQTVITHSRTRVLAFLNIVGHGMQSEFESDPNDMDSEATARKIAQNRDVIVGIKTAHFGGVGWTAIQRAVQAGRLSNTPVMVDDKIFTNSGRTSREKLLDQLRPGDMHTHTFNDRQLEVIDRFTGKVQPYIWEARRRGVLFDLGHGAGSFLWPVASRAMAQGFLPDTISTDLHAESILIAQSDMPNCISKMMLLGMSLPDAVLRSTVNPAKNIHRFPELGTLNEGAVADVAVFALRSGVFAFKDSWHVKRLGTRRLESVLTVRDGKLVFDRDGLGFPLWSTAGAYEVIP